MPFCAQCGHENPASANFCSSCGARLRAEASDSTSTLTIGAAREESTSPDDSAPSGLSVDDQAAVDALQDDTALLIVLRGPNAGSRFLLDTELVTVGRHPQSDIFLDDITVSRRHAEFLRAPEGFRVRDVGSLNGTYVNRDRIDDVVLSGGDEVQVGKYRLVFHTSGRQPGSVHP